MDKDKIESIYRNLSRAEGVERSKIFSLLRTRVAGGLEAQHRGHEAGKYWMTLNSDLEEIVNDCPKDAFEFALETLKLIEGENDPDQYRSWLKGNALTILSNPKIKQMLIEEISNSKSQILPALDVFLNYQTPESVQTKDDLSDYPQSFNFVMSLVIINGLQDQGVAQMANLEVKSNNLLQDKQVRHIIGLYHDIADVKELVEPLFQIV